MSDAPKYQHLPTLYGLDSKGKTKVWKISVYPGQPCADDPVTMITEHGLLDGKQQKALVMVRKGKNIGRANETSPWTQALAEAESKWKKQLDKGYVEDESMLAEAATKPRAMLAHPYEKRKHSMPWPAAVQPKLDGIRCLAHVRPNSVEYYSRNGKPIRTCDHLTHSLRCTFQPGTIVDGELFNPEMTLHNIVSGAKKLSEKSGRLQYWIYDLVHPTARFSERTGEIGRCFISDNDAAFKRGLVRVPSTVVPNEDAMLKIYAQHLEEGYEGSIIRNIKGTYKLGKRSADLLKIKPLESNEFEIIGFKDGIGKFEGAVIWRCITKDGKEFSSTPAGTMADRRAWFAEGAKYVGKMLTVDFAYYTPDGAPFHNVGRVIRDYE